MGSAESEYDVTVSIRSWNVADLRMRMSNMKSGPADTPSTFNQLGEGSDTHTHTDIPFLNSSLQTRFAGSKYT